MKIITALLTTLLLAAPAAYGEDTEGKAILDFANPPMPLAPVRLVGLDGKNISGQPGRTSWWVEPGDHEITVVAIIDDSMGDINPLTESLHQGKDSDPGKTTVTVEASKRYKIGAEVKDHKGDWEPVLYKVEDVK
jgi:hypothetical protein